MKKSVLLDKLSPHFGRTPSDEQIAELLSISRQAVSAWGDDVPELRVYQLRDRFPELETAA